MDTSSDFILYQVCHQYEGSMFKSARETKKDMVRLIECLQSLWHRSTKQNSLEISSDDDMGRGGQKPNTGAAKTLTWDEIKAHDSKTDRWVVIEGQVYDVTNWSNKHPGGSRLLGHYAGQDATEAFSAFHNDLAKVRKYLRPIHVGQVESYTDEEINQDFRKLKETAIKAGYFKPSITFFTVVIGHILLLEAMSYFILKWFGTGWIPFLVSLSLYSIMQVQASWTQHDFGHLSVFQETLPNHIVHHFLMGFIKGCSSKWWNHMHYQHHAKPNVMDKDPDVRIDQLFVVGEVMPVEVAKKKKESMPYNFQHRYFFALGPPLLFPIYFQLMFMRHIYTRRLWVDLVVLMLYYLKFFSLFVPLLGVGWTVAFYFMYRCIESHWFVWVSQSNHIPMHIKPDESNPWLKLQIHATCDIEKSFFNDWFTGHLNFQIEHHLFPTMPRHNLYKVAPLVKSLCEKHGVPYITKPLWGSFVDIYKTLKNSGSLWQHTYQEFYSN